MISYMRVWTYIHINYSLLHTNEIKFLGIKKSTDLLRVEESKIWERRLGFSIKL